MFLWRNKQNHPLIILKYPSYLSYWLYIQLQHDIVCCKIFPLKPMTKWWCFPVCLSMKSKGECIHCTVIMGEIIVLKSFLFDIVLDLLAAGLANYWNTASIKHFKGKKKTLHVLVLFFLLHYRRFLGFPLWRSFSRMRISLAVNTSARSMAVYNETMGWKLIMQQNNLKRLSFYKYNKSSR